MLTTFLKWKSARRFKMGSYAKATMTGFICRLCSEHKKSVIHFYSAKAHELELLKKLTLLPITVEKYDNLPKTICEECIDKLNLQYHLIQRIRKSYVIQRRHRLFHSNGRCPITCPLHSIDAIGLSEEPSEANIDLATEAEDMEFVEEPEKD